jgi:VIT1/CCC1 family predicted Fe2+/Mn2+ transporter
MGETRFERLNAFGEPSIPESSQIIKEENEHENLLVDMIEGKWINYIGSIVWGLNDSLGELTAALAGLTLVLQNTSLNCLVAPNVYHV